MAGTHWAGTRARWPGARIFAGYAPAPGRRPGISPRSRRPAVRRAIYGSRRSRHRGSARPARRRTSARTHHRHVDAPTEGSPDSGHARRSDPPRRDRVLGRSHSGNGRRYRLAISQLRGKLIVPASEQRAEHSAQQSTAAFRAEPAAGITLTQFTQLIWTIAAKDLRSELRTKEAINASVAFSIVILVLFSFAFDPSSEQLQEFSGGLLWLVFSFAGALVLNRSFARETQNDCLDGLLASPAPASALFLGKSLANFVLLIVVEFVSLPVFALFYNLHW